MTRWQFSLRTLLLITAVASAVLALAVRIPEIVVTSAGLAIVAIFVLDGTAVIGGICYSERYPRWFAAVCVVVGTLLLSAAAALGTRAALGENKTDAWKIWLILLLNCSVSFFCYRAAVQTFRRNRTQEPPTRGR